VCADIDSPTLALTNWGAILLAAAGIVLIILLAIVALKNGGDPMAVLL